ncbi:SLAIN motif-containing protein 1-like [Danio aesculapii]|uniref:SLAIN motif-containing protein 1-like n=1 Tax=Danio aesculapii TaxID=1142201 RepID=UPI0024BFB925|nr:SLAIN motif-containing protein 1-like [Danio aesculapii]
MEAAVMAELELQKLQELVRKLELQNEQLRARAITAPPSRACRCFPEDEPFPYFRPHSAAEEDEEEEDDDNEEELMLLDLETLSPSAQSEETWLYVCPRAPPWSASPLSAVQWCRRVLDQQQPEMETPRHSLCQSVSRWRSAFSSPASPAVAGVSPLCTSSPSNPCAPDRAGCSVFPQSSVDSGVCVSALDAGSVPLDSHYKLQDLTDVQVMARLQEESLRQDFASSSSSSSSNKRRSFQCGNHSTSHDDDDDDDDDEEYAQLPPPQPRLQQRSLPHSHTFSSIRDWRRSSSAALQTHTHSQTSSSADTLRRSMPDLLTAVSLTPALNSVSIRSSQSFESSSALMRTCIPAPGHLQTRVQSVGNFSSRPQLKATAYVSPTIKGSSCSSSPSGPQCVSSGVPKASAASQIPSRSGLPRPASFIAAGSNPRSKLSTPVRSLLTPPKSLAPLSALRDGHWRDGCY